MVQLGQAHAQPEQQHTVSTLSTHLKPIEGQLQDTVVARCAACHIVTLTCGVGLGWRLGSERSMISGSSRASMTCTPE